MVMVEYAMIRMTNDIDIVIKVFRADDERIIQEFEPDYYVPRRRVRDEFHESLCLICFIRKL